MNNEPDNFSAITQPAAQAIGKDLPDLKIHGYQVYEKLSECVDRQIVTYLARDNNFNRLVVIKEWGYPSDLQTLSLDYANYLPEIERLQQLDHLNIPRYLNSFPTETGFCLVRAYQSGVSLAELGTLPPSDIKLVADAVLKILRDLHQLHPAIVHQNIKPENIIANTETELVLYLVDFGLQPDGEPHEISATPGFIPPQPLAELGITPTADLYSLGVSLICLLTGTATSQAHSLFDRHYLLQFRHLLPANIDPKLVIWLETMVECLPQPLAIDPVSDDISAHNSAKSTSAEIYLAFNQPKQKIRWLRWGIATSLVLGLGLLARQFLVSDEVELTPAQIARNQSLAKQAEFAASDRGKLLKEKRCIACNLDRQSFTKAELSGAVVPQSSLIGADFSNANLTLGIFQDADLSGANLSRANLRQAAFYGTNLSRANLIGADLSNAKLIYAKLKGASLRDANLSKADLKFAEFQQVDLRNANLTGADLSNADLSYANLQKAILVGAKLDGTILTGATMPDGSIHN
jgi:uncharacterized protein YjbI with pentapeptide repeats